MERKEIIVLKYYQMMYNGNLAEDKKFASCLKVDLNGIDCYEIYNGRKIIDLAWNKVIFHCDLKGNILTEWLDNIYGWELFSESVIYELQSLLKESVQFLPVVVVDEEGEKLKKNYSVMNVLNMLPFDIMNQSKSDFSIDEMDDGEILYDICKPCFYANAISEYDIFRMENNQFALYVSENVRKIVRNMKCPEFSFLEVSTI